MLAPLEYEDVTPEEIAALRAKLIEGGALVLGEDSQFEVHGHGITSKATYDPAALTLTVAVIAKPWIVPMSAIDSGIKSALAG